MIFISRNIIRKLKLFLMDHEFIVMIANIFFVSARFVILLDLFVLVIV